MENASNTFPLYDTLKEKFGADVLGHEESYGLHSITIKKDQLIPVFRFLYEQGYQFLTDLCGVHFPDNKGGELGVVYHLHNLPGNQRLRIKTFFSSADAHISSLTEVYPGANWMERETYDFFGIDFKGHPNLKRILNMDEMNYSPLRKEFPLEDGSRDDKSDQMFGR